MNEAAERNNRRRKHRGRVNGRRSGGTIQLACDDQESSITPDHFDGACSGAMVSTSSGSVASVRDVAVSSGGEATVSGCNRSGVVLSVPKETNPGTRPPQTRAVGETGRLSQSDKETCLVPTAPGSRASHRLMVVSTINARLLFSSSSNMGTVVVG